jgi:hypothetical protein
MGFHSDYYFVLQVLCVGITERIGIYPVTKDNVKLFCDFRLSDLRCLQLELDQIVKFGYPICDVSCCVPKEVI